MASRGEFLDADEFVQTPVQPCFMCGICEGVLVKPRCCKEGHNYCEGCITQWLAQNPKCPIDRSSLTVQTLVNNRGLEEVAQQSILVYNV